MALFFSTPNTNYSSQNICKIINPDTFYKSHLDWRPRGTQRAGVYTANNIEHVPSHDELPSSVPYSP